MKTIQSSLLVFLLLIAGCSSTGNDNDGPPAFINSLRAKPPPPDSLALELNLDIQSHRKDAIIIELSIENKGKKKLVIAHSSNFAQFINYKDSILLNPKRPDLLIYFDDYNETVLPAQEQTTIATGYLKAPDTHHSKVLGHAHFEVVRIDSTEYKEKTDFWLLSEPMLLD